MSKPQFIMLCFTKKVMEKKYNPDSLRRRLFLLKSFFKDSFLMFQTSCSPFCSFQDLSRVSLKRHLGFKTSSRMFIYEITIKRYHQASPIFMRRYFCETLQGFPFLRGNGQEKSPSAISFLQVLTG